MATEIATEVRGVWGEHATPDRAAAAHGIRRAQARNLNHRYT